MEHEERSKGLAEYVERWNGGIFEVMAYSGSVRIKEDPTERFRRLHPELSRYQKVLILPLPRFFDWTKINIDAYKPHLPNAIVITEDEIRYKRKGRKKFRPLTAFLDKPGRISIEEVMWTRKIGERSKAWIDKAKFMDITKRNLYVDKFYADQIFNRGEDNKNL